MPDSARPILPVLHGLSEIASRYDGFIVDLWGVMHDGVQPYPGARETLPTDAGLERTIRTVIDQRVLA